MGINDPIGVAAYPTGGMGLTLDANGKLPTQVLPRVQNNGTDVGARHNLNLIAGSNVTLTVTDTAASDRVDVTIASTAGSLLASGRGADLTAASTITVTNQVHRVSGGTTINTINGAIDGAVVTLISTGGTITYSSAGNVWATSGAGNRTVPVHAALTLVYSSADTTWQVAGVGS